MEKIFDNTETAFALKSDTELERAYFLFKMIKSEPLVRIGTAVTNFALKTHMPVEQLIRATVFDHFCNFICTNGLVVAVVCGLCDVWLTTCPYHTSQSFG